MLVSELISSAMRKLGCLASGESPTTYELADGLSALQVMLRSWSAERLFVFASTKESFSLEAGTASYTWGSGGVITTTRPHQILGGYVQDSAGESHPIEYIMSEGRYRSIGLKTLPGRPNAIFFHPAYPLATLYVYPVPQTVESMYLDSIKPFTETSSFDATSSTLAFPPNYEEALIYNFAVRYASEFGKAIPVEVASIASTSYTRITTLNSANQVEPARLNLPAGFASGSGYSINSDRSQ